MSKTKKIVTEYRHYDLPADFPVLVLHGERWTISDVKPDRLHFHNYVEFGICQSESGRMDFGDSSLPYKEGDVTIIARNYPHTTYADPGIESRWSWIFIDLDAFAKKFDLSTVSNPLGTTNFIIKNKSDIPRLYNYLCALIEEMSEKKPGYQNAITGLTSAIIVELFRMTENSQDEANTKNASFLSMQPALDYVADNYMQQFSIEDLADMCHVSPTHFRRVFSAIMGTSPLEYVNNTRIDRACIALQNTDISILDISEAVGFHSISSFNRAFLKRTEMSPREWRKKYNSGQTVTKKGPVLEFRGWL